MHLATLESHSEQRGWLTSYQSIKIEILNISSRLNVEWMQHKITNMNSTTFKNLTLTEQMLSGELWQESAKKPSGFDQRHSRRHPTPSAHRTIKTSKKSDHPRLILQSPCISPAYIFFSLSNFYHIRYWLTVDWPNVHFHVECAAFWHALPPLIS